MKPGIKLCFLPVCLALACLCGCSAQAARDRYMRMGEQRLGRGQYKDASLAFQKALQKDPAYAPAYRQMGVAEVKRGQKGPLALHAFQMAAQLDPRDEVARVGLAELYLAAYVETGRTEFPLDEVKTAADWMVAHRLQAPETPLLAACVALSENDPQRAATLFAQAEARASLPSNLVIAQANALLWSGQAGPAESRLLALLNRAPDTLPAWDTLYVLYRTTRRNADLEALLKRRAAQLPASPETWLQLAACHFQSNRAAEGAAALQHLLDDPGRFPKGHLQVQGFYQMAVSLDGGAPGEPPRTAYQRRAAELLLLEGRDKEAHEIYLGLAGEKPGDAGVRRMRGMLSLAAQQPGRAVSELLAARLEYPNDAALEYVLGQAYLAGGDLEKAEAAFTRCLALHGNAFLGNLALADLAALRGNSGAARRFSEQLLAAAPREAQAMVRHAAAMGSPSELGRVLQEHPRYAEARLRYALWQAGNGRTDEAVATLRQLSAQPHRDPRHLVALAEVLLRQGHPQEAAAVIREGAAGGAEERAVKQGLALAALRTGHYSLAKEELARLRDGQAASAALEAQFGEACLRAGAPREAIPALQKAVGLAPAETRPRLLLANALERDGQSRAAIEQYERVLAQDPGNAAGMNYLAYLLSEQDAQLDRALELARKALGRDPGNPDFEATLAAVYLKKKSPAQAIQIFKKQAGARPGDPGVRYRLAAALIENGDTEAARAELQAALKSGPDAALDFRIRELLATLD